MLRIRQQTHKKLKIYSAVLALILMIAMLERPVFAEVDPWAEFPIETNSWKNWPEGPAIYGRTACLIDSETGSVLYGKGAMAERYPASITKVMTALLVLEHCNLEDIVTMTETGLADAYGDSSNIDPKIGEQFTVEQCLQMLLIKSANDVATQLAEFTAGSVQAFTDLMNQKAESLGCVSTHFNNASGLDDANHYTSALDMCYIMREALKYDKFREIIAMPEVVIPATPYTDARYYDTHVYLRQQWNIYYYEPCIGGKTGYTDMADSTLVCAAESNGRTLICTVMGAPDTGTNADDMVTLFDYGFSQFNGVDLSRGADMFTDPAQLSPVATEAPQVQEQAVTQAQTETNKGTETAVSPTETPKVTEAVVSETPQNITTSDQKLENAENKNTEKKSSPVRTVVYIVLICILAVIILLLILVQINVTRRRKQNKKRRRR